MMTWSCDECGKPATVFYGAETFRYTKDGKDIGQSVDLCEEHRRMVWPVLVDCKRVAIRLPEPRS
jgi:hypothetical protein